MIWKSDINALGDKKRGTG